MAALRLEMITDLMKNCATCGRGEVETPARISVLERNAEMLEKVKLPFIRMKYEEAVDIIKAEKAEWKNIYSVIGRRFESPKR